MTRQHYRQHTRYLHRATTKLPRQHHRQHDSATTLHHNQFCIGSAITSLTQQRHHQHDSVAISCHDQCHLDSTIASMTSGHVLPHLAIRFGGSPPIRLWGLRSTSPTIITNLDSRRLHHHHNAMGHFTKPAKSFS
jgi:hypothetical protein